MSSAVVSTSAALGRPFVFDAKAVPEVSLPPEPTGGCPQRVRPSLSGATADARLAHVTLASQLDIRPAPEMVSSGIDALDTLTGGLPRGCLTEICGPASSGRTTLLLSALAAATRRGEFCVVIDASDALDPYSAVAADVELDRLLWVRCGESSLQNSASSEKRARSKKFLHQNQPSSNQPNLRQSENCLEQVLRATDLLLESGGFGLVVLDLGDLPSPAARRIPLTTWFRFRRAIEHTPTILLAIEQNPIAGSCCSQLLQLGQPNNHAAVGGEQSEFSREAAAWESPAGQRRVAGESASESRRDGTISATHTFPQNAAPTPPHLLTGLDITAELIRSRLERKPARSTAAFASKTAWAG